MLSQSADAAVEMLSQSADAAVEVLTRQPTVKHLIRAMTVQNLSPSAPTTSDEKWTPEQCEEYVFRTSQADGRSIIPWHRIREFQIQSLAMITQVMVSTSPAYASRTNIQLFLPGELDVSQLEVADPICLYASPLNPGAAALAAELVAALSGLTNTSKAPPGGDAPELQLPAGDDAEDQATHFLLYLSAETFVGELGSLFGTQVELLLKTGLPYLMIHENDPEKHGCEFGHFFRTTPQHLIDDGLYGPLAVAFFPGPHRQVSLRLAAKALGARPRKTGTEAAAKSLNQACSASRIGLRRLSGRSRGRLPRSSRFGQSNANIVDVAISSRRSMEGSNNTDEGGVRG